MIQIDLLCFVLTCVDVLFLQDGIMVHSVASLISGFVSTAVSMPVDITKTRLQTMKGQMYTVRADSSESSSSLTIMVAVFRAPLIVWSRQCKPKDFSVCGRDSLLTFCASARTPSLLLLPWSN